MEGLVLRDLLTLGALVDTLDALGQVVLYGRQAGHDGRAAEAVGGAGEAGEVALDARVEDHGRLSVAQGRPVLVQQVHQLTCHYPGGGRVKELELN